MIYEFDASTLKTVGAPFKGHTSTISGLALSSDCVLLASSSYDTIKLWTFQSRQLLASFDVQNTPFTLVLSPDSRQLAYTTFHDSNIYICGIPADILASIELAEEPQPSTSKSKRSCRADLLNSDATRRPVRCKPVITPVMSPMPRLLHTRVPHTFLHFLRKLLPSSHTDAVPPIRTDEPRNPLDFPATSPLPRPLIKLDENFSTHTSTTHHSVLRRQYSRNPQIQLTSNVNLAALSDRSCIAGYRRCSSRAG
ncbi:hypothetical protein DFJ58DRAFT_99253 [Suillus subalutaceus]|uniref:uncharacterized protein n=1 Tax=Suillus subalutaceus TaxID=48586 RepID=UPI001B86E9DF|nr:uncharacterized protein DFJ58DRAFT_99253 [Suillus subalutaceus]KAG1868303.1 hypothetical protein DFJ58DRAFT_99253 [Suillus subalutaceus]